MLLFPSHQAGVANKMILVQVSSMAHPLLDVFNWFYVRSWASFFLSAYVALYSSQWDIKLLQGSKNRHFCLYCFYCFHHLPFFPKTLCSLRSDPGPGFTSRSPERIRSTTQENASIALRKLLTQHGDSALFCFLHILLRWLMQPIVDLHCFKLIILHRSTM